jgi:hypothetical protein
MIELGDLERIPQQYRHTIAQWLLERANAFQPSPLFPDVSMARVALQGAAVDLVLPSAEDSTIEHAEKVRGILTEEN